MSASLAPASAAEAMALYQALLDSHPEPTFFLDVEGRLQQCNRAFALFVGSPPAALLGRPFTELVCPEVRDVARATWARVVGGAAQAWQTEFDGPGGTVSIGHVTLAPTVVAGRVAGAQGVARDVTVYRVVEEQLQARVSTDPLTGLANRTQFVEAVARNGA